MTVSRGIVASIDRILPKISITNPGSGATVSGTVTIQASASDNDRIASIQFQVNGTNLGAPQTTAPFQVNYDTRGLVNGGATFSAVATDRVGNVTIVNQGVTVANAPAVNFYSPGNGATVTGTVTLAANVTQYGTGCSVYFYIDGNNIYAQGGGSGTYSIGYDSHYLGVGWHTITCIVNDYQGNSTRFDYSMYVNNQAPAAGYTILGDLKYWDDGEGNYQGGRQHIEPYDGTGGNWIWGNTGAKIGYLNLPGNPDPTHYQMRAWFYGSNIEGGSDGNQVHFDLLINSWYNDVWVNGPQGASGPVAYVNGGETIGSKRWQSRPDWNTAVASGIGVYYDFVTKPGYGS